MFEPLPGDKYVLELEPSQGALGMADVALEATAKYWDHVTGMPADERRNLPRIVKDLFDTGIAQMRTDFAFVAHEVHGGAIELSEPQVRWFGEALLYLSQQAGSSPQERMTARMADNMRLQLEEYLI